MGDGTYQSLAKDMNIHCEVESEDSRRQHPESRYTNNIRHIQSVRVCIIKRRLITILGLKCECCGYMGRRV
jgi:hypothetical protein